MRARPFVAAATVAIVVLGALPAASGGFKVPHIPNQPKVPKLKAYQVTVDAAGYVDFDWTWNDTQACIPGTAKTVSEELSFELGKPRKSTVTIVGDSVIMPFALGGAAKTKTTLSAYKTSNYCPPTAPAFEPPEPECKTTKGKLGMTLLSEESKAGADDPAPLGAGILVSFVRRGGESQTAECMEHRPTLRPVKADRGVQIGTLPMPGGGLTLPLTNTGKFYSLKPGKRIQRSIAIGGGCDNATAQASRLPTGILRCTIKGRVVVTIKRLAD